MMKEREIIELFYKGLSKLGKGFSKRGDDVNWFLHNKEKVVLSCDMLVQSTDLPKGFPLNLASRKSIAACVSDFAAKGVKPLVALISLALPKHIKDDDIHSLLKGYRMAEREFGIKIIGGDTNEGKEIILDTFLLGFSDKVIGRRGAKEGDVIFVTGSFGYTSAGLKIFLEKLKADKNFKKRALKAFTRPKPKLKFGIVLKERSLVNSSIDSSDGLAFSLYQLAEANKLSFLINKLPSDDDLLQFARINKLDPLDLIFYGGEEYEIVGTSSRKKFDEIEDVGRKLGVKVSLIGEVKKGEPIVQYKGEDRTLILEKKGFTHL